MKTATHSMIALAAFFSFVVVLYLFVITARMVRAWLGGGDWQSELRKVSRIASASVAAGVVVVGILWMAEFWSGHPH